MDENKERKEIKIVLDEKMMLRIGLGSGSGRGKKSRARSTKRLQAITTDKRRRLALPASRHSPLSGLL